MLLQRDLPYPFTVCRGFLVLKSYVILKTSGDIEEDSVFDLSDMSNLSALY